MKVGWSGWVALSFMSFALTSACGGSDDNGPPDSGYGEKQPVPAISCDALCARQGDCFEHLCNEDTASTRYTGIGSVIQIQCKANCTEALVMSHAKDWSCLFESSCRAAIGHDVCHINASYQCQ